MKLSSLFFGLLSFIVFGSSAAVRANCTQTPDFSAMTAIFTEHTRQKTTNDDAIVILPFYDNSTTKKDPLLAESIPYAFYDLFATKSERIIHPFVAIEALNQLGLRESALAEQGTAQTIAQKLKARFVIYGSVQRTLSDEMRFFIWVFDEKSGTNLQPVFEFATPLNDLFFTQLKTGLDPLLKDLSLKKKDVEKTANLPHLQAFRYYAKGLGYSRTYDEAQLQLALVWFEKALKENFWEYPDAAREMARSHFMLALIHRLTQRNIDEHWIEAQKLLQNFSKIDTKKPSPKDKLTTRFASNQQYLLEALTAFKNGDKGKAQEISRSGLDAVPEDGQLKWLNQQSGGHYAKDSAEAVCITGF